MRKKTWVMTAALALALSLASCHSGRFGACVSTINNGINGYSNHHGRCIGNPPGPAAPPTGPVPANCYKAAVGWNCKVGNTWVLRTTAP